MQNSNNLKSINAKPSDALEQPSYVIVEKGIQSEKTKSKNENKNLDLWKQLIQHENSEHRIKRSTRSKQLKKLKRKCRRKKVRYNVYIIESNAFVYLLFIYESIFALSFETEQINPERLLR